MDFKAFVEDLSKKKRKENEYNFAFSVSVPVPNITRVKENVSSQTDLYQVFIVNI